MSNKVIVGGVGMIPFNSPKRAENYLVMGSQAISLALEDAGISYDKVEQAYAGYVYGDSTCGQNVIYEAGMSGIPIINVNNNCSTGSTAIWLARQAIEAGIIDCALAVGFEQMTPGALQEHWKDRPGPIDRLLNKADEIEGPGIDAPLAMRIFGGAGKEYQDRYGMPDEVFAMISVKARKHAENNERAIFRTLVDVDEVCDGNPIYGPLTRMMCCPPSCGAAAAILCSEAFAKKHGIDTTVAIKAQALTTDTEETFTSNSMINLAGFEMSRAAADQVYAKAGITAEDVDVVELHDCFAANEIITYEALGLCPVGGAEEFIRSGNNTYGGKVVTNPSGGLLSKGHPLGATGLSQCFELTNQIRGNCGPRQVEGVTNALAHNIGLGGACVVTLYQKNA